MCCCGCLPMPVELMPNGPPRVSARPPAGFRLTGWHVFWCLIVFFGIVGAVNAVMMRAAMRTMPGLDARNGYDVSQRFNAELAAADAQDARGWRAQIAVTRESDGHHLRIEIADAEGRPVSGQWVDVTLAHPGARALDAMVLLHERAPGRYEGQVANVPPGMRMLQLSVRETADGAMRFASRNRLKLEP